MNIGIFTETYFPQLNGVVTSIQMLRNELIKRGHTVYVFTTTDPDAKDNIDDTNVFRLPSSPLVFLPERRFAYICPPNIIFKIRKLNLDLVHTQTEFSLGFFGKAVAELDHIPLIHTYHTMYEDYVHYLGDFNIVTPTIAKKFSRFFCNRADCVVTPTEKSKKRLTEYGVSKQIHVIPTGLDFNYFCNSNFTKVSIDNLKTSLGFNLDDPILLSLGRVSKEKSIDKIFEFMPKLLQKIPNAKLVIVGDGPMVKVLKNISETLNIEHSVRFLGNKPWEEIGKYYRLADVFVSASESETQGLTYIEAILSKVPLLVKEDETLIDIVENGVDGFLFKTQDDFINYCVTILSNKNLSNTVTESAYKKIQSLNSETFADRILDLYDQTIKDYKHSPTLRRAILAKLKLNKRL